MTLDRLYSDDFITSWQGILSCCFKWKKTDDGLLQIPNLLPLKKPIHSNAPLLAHGSLPYKQAVKLAEDQHKKKHHFLLRTIAPRLEKPVADAPVLMRLALTDFKGSNDLWDNGLKSVCRNRIRKGKQQAYILTQEPSEKNIKNAYDVFQTIMHRLGTPAWPKKLLAELLDNKMAQLFTLYREDKAVAMLVLLLDKKASVACVAWCGALDAEMSHGANYMTHWAALEYAMEQGYEIFDFGRSPMGGGTYQFKKKWGAQPVALCYFTQEQTPQGALYRKYKVAARIWRALPRFVVNAIGARLVRFLADM